MRSIFIGFLFVFLDFNLNIGSFQIELIPDFIGYILIVQGVKELNHLSPRFNNARQPAVAMAVYSGVLFAMALFGIATSGVVAFILGLVSTIASLYISYCIVMGVKDAELSCSRDLNADGLYAVWKLMAILSIALYVMSIIPVLGIICIIACLVVGVVFLVSFNKTKNLYYENFENGIG